VIQSERHEVLTWAEVRDLGGRRRVEIGSVPSVAAARAACEADAQRRLRRQPDDTPVDVRIAQPRRRR
jgi:hypothetical protein